MVEYQKLVGDRQKQASICPVPSAAKVDRFQLPRFSDYFVGNNPDQNVPVSQVLNNATAAGSSPRLDAQFPQRLVSSIISDIHLKHDQIPRELQDRAVKLIADAQAKNLLMSSPYYEILATRLLEQFFNLCDRASKAELERDIAIEERDKARAHARSIGAHYDIATDQAENTFEERLQLAGSRAGGLGSLASGAHENTTGVEDTGSHTSPASMHKQQVKEAGERQDDQDAEEGIDQGPIRPGRRRANVGNLHKSRSVDTDIPIAPKKDAAATPDQSETTKSAGHKPDAPSTNIDHHDLRGEMAIARLGGPSGGGKSQVVPQKRRKQTPLPSPKYLLNVAREASKAEVARSRDIVTSDTDSRQADPDTIVVEMPATKGKKGKEKAVEETAPPLPYESESDESVVVLGSRLKQRQKTSTIPDSRNQRRAQDISDEDHSTTDEDGGSNYSDDEETPAAKHQQVNKKGKYIAMPLENSHRTIASTAASISIVVELCLFRPDHNNTYTLERVYEIPPSMAGHERELRVAVEDFGREDKVLLEARRFVYGSQLMIKTPYGVWRALENPADYRSHVRSYRNKVQTAVAKGGRQDGVGVSFRCMVYLERESSRARAAFGEVF